VEGHVDAVAAAIARLLSAPDERFRMGQQGQQFVKRCYSWNAIAQNLAEVYTKILQENRTKPDWSRHADA
ncbi:MAG: glycosyltransferase, partial [Thermosynechococcaceae cyanobacterium]